MTAGIHLGYVVGTGEPVEIPLRHTAVTGQTQESGKTTTLEGLISRSGLQAVAYVTKRGESSFHVMNPIPPYFQERADWKFVQSLLEASTETKLKFEQSWIMRASEGARTLQDVQANIHKFLKGVRDTTPVKQRKGAEPKERWIQRPAKGLSGDVYYVLDKYLDDIMPQLAEMPYTTQLELADGLNVMDLRDYEFPLQALVIRSVTDFIREQLEDTINIIPEAWKFAPKQRGSPVRLAAEEYVREAAAMKNFLWIDSQDLAGVADVLMRQVGVWLFGVQRAKHEIERALDHMPEGLPARRPRPADIATLNKGQFYVCFGREMHKVYVQPAWMSAAHAEAIARGEEEVDSAREILRGYDREHKERSTPVRSNDRESRPIGADRRIPSGTDHSRDSAGERVSEVAASDGEVTVIDPQMSWDQAKSHFRPESEEAMWKEKYEALKKEFEEFRAKVDGRSDAVATASDGVMRGHASPASSSTDKAAVHVQSNGDEDPGVLQVNTEQRTIRTAINKPEVEVRVKRRVIEMDGETVEGMIAVLLSEGFFDETKNGAAVVVELRRRGLSFGDQTPYKRLGEIAAQGFLTKEGKAAFRAVPGMKVNIVEA